jgi:iron complex outermembrane receptor protein
LPNGFNLTPDAQPPYQDTIYTLYTQFDYAFSPATRLIVGGQGVKTQEQDWHFTPRLGLTHQFDQHFSAKLLYSEAYRAATQVERNIELFVIHGNPALSPETVGTFDARVFYRQDDQQYSLTYFHSRQQELIVRDFLPGQAAQSFFNAGELTLQGVELEGKWSLAERWFLTGSLSYFALNLYVYNLWDQAVYVPEINSMNVNSVPVKAGRSAYAGIKLRF